MLSIRTAILFVSIILIIGCQNNPGVDIVAEANKIRQLDSLWLEAMVAKDIEKSAGFFASDGVLMPNQSASITGREKIQEWFGLWLPDPNVSSTFKPETIEVSASGDIAYDRGTFHYLMENKSYRVEDSGKYLIVWKKIENEWKAILDMSNSNLAAPIVDTL